MATFFRTLLSVCLWASEVSEMHKAVQVKARQGRISCGITGGRRGSSRVKVMLSGRRTMGEDKRGTEGKKHNKKHHLFVRMPCCIGFFISSGRAKAAESEHTTEQVNSLSVMFAPINNFFFNLDIFVFISKSSPRCKKSMRCNLNIIYTANYHILNILKMCLPVCELWFSIQHI